MHILCITYNKKSFDRERQPTIAGRVTGMRKYGYGRVPASGNKKQSQKERCDV